MQYAMILPMNHAHTAVAGPPELMGAPKVAGTEPNTPRIEMAYETVDHLEKCRCNTYKECELTKILISRSPTGVYPMRTRRRSSSSDIVAMML